MGMLSCDSWSSVKQNNFASVAEGRLQEQALSAAAAVKEEPLITQRRGSRNFAKHLAGINYNFAQFAVEGPWSRTAA